MEFNDVVSVGYVAGQPVAEPQKETQPAAAADAAETVTETSAVEEKSAEANEEVVTDESEAEATKNDTDTEADSDEQPKKSGADKRIEKLLKRETAARREAEELRARLAELEAKVTAPVEQKVDPQPKQIEIKLPAEPQPEDFNTNADYVKALVKHEREVARLEAEAKQKTADNQAAQVKAQQHLNDAYSRGTEKYDDYAEVVNSVKIKPTNEMVSYVLSVDQPEDLIYHLSQNTDEMEAITKLTGTNLVRALAKVEARLSPVSKKSVAAPSPIKPVGTKGTPASGPNAKMSDDEWLAARRAQREKSKR